MLEILDPDADQLGAAQRAGKPHQQQRTVAQGREVITRRRQQPAQDALPYVDCYLPPSLPQVICYRRTRVWEATDGTADQHAGRTELLEAVSTRYGGATRPERSRILDEFAAVTGYHRKHAIRLLSSWGDREKDEQQGDGLGRVGRRVCHYGPEVRDALIQLWEVADRVCSKRLQPTIAVLLPALERYGLVALDEATRSCIPSFRFGDV